MAVSRAQAKHSSSETSKLREAAQLIFDEGIAALPKAEERSFASIAKATMEAAIALDSTEPPEESDDEHRDEVAKRRNERDERVRATQAALRAAQAARSDPGD